MQKWEEIEQKKEYLEGYINSKNREALIKDQIQQLRLDTMFPALQGDGMPRGSSQKDLSDYTAKIESLMEELKKINRIIDNRKRGKRHHIIINAEGIGHSASMAKRIEAATGIETRATILGYMQRGGAPTCKDRVYASIMGAKAVELLEEGKTNRVVAYKHGEFLDFDIQEALNMKKDIPEDQYEISKLLIR